MTATPPFRRARASIRQLYEGGSDQAHQFRYALLVFDLVTLLFIVATSFVPRNAVIETLDVVVRPRHPGGLQRAPVRSAAIACATCCIRSHGPTSRRSSRSWRRWSARRPASCASCAPCGFLRSYQLLMRLRRDFAYFRDNEEIIIAVANFVVFLFVMTGFVYETQHASNPHIVNYADALYFTVTALTTTGFGDITLPGTTGRLISVAIMIFGVTLFFGLAKAVLRPNKVRFPCPTCGLLRHDPDAVHCKACGQVLNIPNEDE